MDECLRRTLANGRRTDDLITEFNVSIPLWVSINIFTINTLHTNTFFKEPPLWNIWCWSPRSRGHTTIWPGSTCGPNGGPRREYYSPAKTKKDTEVIAKGISAKGIQKDNMDAPMKSGAEDLQPAPSLKSRKHSEAKISLEAFMVIHISHLTDSVLS